MYGHRKLIACLAALAVALVAVALGRLTEGALATALIGIMAGYGGANAASKFANSKEQL